MPQNFCLESKGEISHLNLLILLDLAPLETVLKVGELSFPMKHIIAAPDLLVYVILLSFIFNASNSYLGGFIWCSLEKYCSDSMLGMFRLYFVLAGGTAVKVSFLNFGVKCMLNMLPCTCTISVCTCTIYVFIGHVLLYC